MRMMRCSSVPSSRLCRGRVTLWILIWCLLSSPGSSAFDKRDEAEVPFSYVDRTFSSFFSLDIGDWNVQYVLDLESGTKHVVVRNLLDEGHYQQESQDVDPLSDFIEVSGPDFDGSESQALTFAHEYLKSKDWVDTDFEEFEWVTWRRRFVERETLVKFYYQVLANETNRLSLADGGNWLTDESVCKWIGVSCGALSSKALLHSSTSGDISSDGREIKVLEPSTDRPPDDAVTAIQLPSLGLEGIVPPVLFGLPYLQKLRLDHNRLKSTLPTELAHLTTLRYVDLSNNKLSGTVPESYGGLTSLQLFSLGRNHLTGSVPTFSGWSNSLQKLDLGGNGLTGTISSHIAKLTNLRSLVLEDNILTGRLPDLSQMTRLTELDLSSNVLSGNIPSSLGSCPQLRQVVLGDNAFKGPIPPNLFGMERLRTLILTDNQLSGELDLSLARGHSNLGILALTNNLFATTVPTSLGLLTKLNVLLASGNKFRGSLPHELSLLNERLFMNWTNNLLTGEIPSAFCDWSHDYGCNKILCPAGTFNSHGHATLFSGCHECLNIPIGEEDVLGRVICEGYSNLYGDIDGDGIVSQREVLRLLYVHTAGHFWGVKFRNWFDMGVDQCALEGIVCVHGSVAKIDLSEASLCSETKPRSARKKACLGLPTELGLLSGLEILQLSRQTYLHGTVPTEIGSLSKLRHLDISGSPLSGRLPTEVGSMTSLIHFLASFCNFEGTLPTELFLLTRLEKLHLTDSHLSGTLPERIEMSSLRELMISRNQISGSIPPEIAHMAKLENLEIYSNKLHGSLPAEIATCSYLKRMDLFNNQITGTIPAALSSLNRLQILHAKQNSLTGTIPNEIGFLENLTWVDLSNNFLHGTIPASFGSSKTMRDFRVADNMLHQPVPESFCNNLELNSGATLAYGCDGVVCPLGTYSDTGFATNENGGCLPCPEDQSTVYVGSTGCRTFDDSDILTIMHAVMEGIPWPKGYQDTWNKENPDDVCHWEGIECNEKGEIGAITIPVPPTMPDDPS